MTQACRTALSTTTGGENAGLLLDFYLFETGDEGKARRTLFKRTMEASWACVEIYRAAFHRWKGEVKPDQSKKIHVAGRLIVGLGAGTVLETGITLHHTYGVPVIPGSALKGLAAAYCAKVWGETGETYRREPVGAAYKALFGTGDDSGCIVFHDAWILPESLGNGGGLLLDVMTPHHTDYYMKGGQEHPPADTDKPVPVTFLSVAGDFRLAVSCIAGTTEQRKEWSALAMELLLQAVGEWGAGGKTSGGYGRMA
jgi:CRISPR-associated protein Cmr6